MNNPTSSAAKFDSARAQEYEQQSRIALAGYEACHELAACLLGAALGDTPQPHVLVAGAGGTATEITTCARLHPGWHYTAVDPSAPMLNIAQARIAQANLSGRTALVHGYVDDLNDAPVFDAATLIGVLHHLPGQDAKQHILASIARRLKPGAPFILAGNHYAYADHPLLLSAWGERWRMHGADQDEIQAKLGKILQGADPPESEQTVFDLLAQAGFVRPQRFFSSLFWGAWICFRSD